MAAVDDIRSTLDVSQIAQFLGTDEQTAQQALDQALAQLVGSMGGHAADPRAAADLSRAALDDHVASAAYGDSVDINDIDALDGEKIVGHVFSGQDIQTLGGGVAGSLLQRLLPLLAPIVMGYLAQKLQERMGGGARAPQQQAPAPQAPAPKAPSPGDRGFQIPTSGTGDTGLRMDPGTPAAEAPQQQAPAGGAGDLLGGLLRDILLGGRR